MKVIKYKCIKSFYYDLRDDDGRPTNKKKLIKEGSLWDISPELDKSLELLKLKRWFTYSNGTMICHMLDINKKTLESNFKKVYRYEKQIL